MDMREPATATQANQQFFVPGASVARSQVASLNQRIEPTLSDLIHRMDAANDRAAERADMAERLADLLCGERQCSGEGSMSESPSMSLLSQVEQAIDHGDQVNARIDAALHRISRRLTPAKPNQG